MQDRRTGKNGYMDVHGAGAQRCDIKSGNPSSLPKGRGPQGVVMRIYNFVRCVRGGMAEPCTVGPKVEKKQMSNFKQRGKFQDRQQRQGMNRRPSGDDFVHRLDKDGDGKVSRSEFDGPNEHFQRLDKNNDGFLSSDEAPQGPPPDRSRRHR